MKRRMEILAVKGRGMADRDGRVRPGQLVVAQVVLAGVAVASTGPGWVLTGVAAAAGAVLIATFGRSGGRWWFQAVARQRRFRRRRRIAAAQVVAAAVNGRPGRTGPPHLAWLRTLAPGLTLRPITVGALTLGVGADAAGWFAVAEVGSLCDEGSGTGAAIPFRELATLVQPGEDRVPVSTVQVIVVPDGSPARIRPAWVAVRITPADAVSVEGAGGVEAVERVMIAAATRAARTLERHGWPARVLDPDGLLAALVEATGLDGPPQEHWSTWRSGRLVHTCYRLTGWEPARGMLAAGVRRIAVAYSARDEPAILAVVTAEPRAILRVSQDVVASVDGTGVRLRRLDGEQAPAVYGGAPTAGLPVPAAPRARPRAVRLTAASLGSIATTSKGEQG
jgi:type VII secretion protein EccE